MKVPISDIEKEVLAFISKFKEDDIFINLQMTFSEIGIFRHKIEHFHGEGNKVSWSNPTTDLAWRFWVKSAYYRTDAVLVPTKEVTETYISMHLKGTTCSVDVSELTGNHGDRIYGKLRETNDCLGSDGNTLLYDLESANFKMSRSDGNKGAYELVEKKKSIERPIRDIPPYNPRSLRGVINRGIELTQPMTAPITSWDDAISSDDDGGSTKVNPVSSEVMSELLRDIPLGFIEKFVRTQSLNLYMVKSDNAFELRVRMLGFPAYYLVKVQRERCDELSEHPQLYIMNHIPKLVKYRLIRLINSYPEFSQMADCHGMQLSDIPDTYIVHNPSMDK